MPRGLNKKKIKKVIESLREGPKSWSQLKQLGIPATSLTRILVDYLKYWGLTSQVDKRWIWFQQLPEPYSYKEEYERFLHHSQLLIPTFEALLRKPTLDPSDTAIYAEQHIKTSYPEVDETLKKFREVLIQANEAENELLRDYPDLKMYHNLLSFATPDPNAPFRTDIFKIKEIPVDTRLKCAELYDRKMKAELDFSDEIQKIIIKTRHGTPLSGTCGLCPPRTRNQD